MACVAHSAAVAVAKNYCRGIDGSGHFLVVLEFPHASAVVITFGYGDLRDRYVVVNHPLVSVYDLPSFGYRTAYSLGARHLLEKQLGGNIDGDRLDAHCLYLW